MAKRSTDLGFNPRSHLPRRRAVRVGPVQRARFSPALDLRAALLTTALATGVLMGASVWSPQEAAAGCVDTSSAPNEVFCDDTQTTIDDTINITALGGASDDVERHYLFTADGDVDVEITPTGDIDGFGLAVETTEPGAAIIVDHEGEISIDAGNDPSVGGEGVFSLLTNGGNVIYTGDGSIIDEAGTNFGLEIDTGDAAGGDINIGMAGTGVQPDWQGTVGLSATSGTGDQSIFLDGGTITTVGDPVFGDAIRMNSSSGNLNLTLEGGTQLINDNGAPGTVFGIRAFSGTGDITIESDAVIGSDAARFFNGIIAGTDGVIDITQSGEIFASSVGINVNAFDATVNPVNVTNEGDIDSDGIGIRVDAALNRDVTITNTAGAQILGEDDAGVLVLGGDLVTLINAGTITGANGVEIGSVAEVDIDNDGTITGQENEGIAIDGVGGNVAISNQDGTITGFWDGIDINDVAGIVLVDNRDGGSITGQGGDGIDVDGALGVRIVNDGDIDPAGTILGADDGVVLADIGAEGVIVNNSEGGSVTGTNGDGVHVNGSAGDVDIDNSDGGSITGGDDGVEVLNAGSDVTIDNEGGAITGQGDEGITIDGVGGNVIISNLDGDISGFWDGIDINDVAGSVMVDNRLGGSITGTNGDGIDVVGAGSVSIDTTDGAITAGEDGIFVRDVTGDINIQGTGSTITAGGAGIDVEGDGAVTVVSGEINAGTGSGVVATSTSDDVVVITTEKISVDSGLYGAAAISTGGNATVIVNGEIDPPLIGAAAITVGPGTATVITNALVQAHDIGILGENTGTGDVQITNNAAVESDGIGLQAINTGDGDTIVTVNGEVSGFSGANTGTDGVNVDTDGVGDVVVTTTGDGAIFADEDGIDVEKLGAGNVSVVTNAAIDAGVDGIHVDHGGGGNISITANDVISGGQDGIDAMASGAGGVSITTEQAVTGGVNGIRAGSDSGNLTITANGAVSGAGEDGIQARSPGGIVTVTANAPVSGADDGIEATGSIVTVNSNVSATGGDNGIEANGGVIVVNASGTTTGGTDGIQARSTTGDDITITTAGVVTGGDDGVDAIVTGGDGDITIAANATITGGDDGIFASTEDGDITIAGSGDITGNAGQGIEAQSTAGGSIDVNVSGAVSGETGILLSAVGSGTIDLMTSGPVVGTAGDGINTTAEDGATTIVAEDTVTGEDDGIDASASGDGDITVTTTAAVTGTTGDGIVTSANDGDTLVTAGADVTGAADGIDATATGDGNVTIATIAGTTIEGTAGNGIEAETASGNVVIDADAEIIGGVDGIHARSGAGDIDISGGGDITGGTGQGIDAASTGGGSVDVAVSGAVSGTTGIDLSAVGAGTIDLVTDGPVVGTAGDGINTTAEDGPTTIVANDTVTGEEDGIDATATGDGAITITANAAVTGTTGDGIVTSANDGDTTIIANDTVTGNDDGIEATATGEGDITVTANAAVTGTTGDGIDTSAAEGNTTITANADVTGGEDGIDADASGGGDITVDVAEGVTVRGNNGSGVDISTDTGTGTVDNDGIIEGTLAAITGATSEMTDGLINIINGAGGTIRNLSGSRTDIAIDTTGQTDIDNDGLIVGRINTGADDDAFTNDGLWRTRGDSNFGGGNDTLTNTGRIVVAEMPAVDETARLLELETFTNASTGVIDLVDGVVGQPTSGNNAGVQDQLTIQGTYVGESGSIVEMDLGLTAGLDPQDTSDQLVLSGSASGTTDFVFNIVDSIDPVTGLRAVARTNEGGRVLFENGQLLDAPIVAVENRGDLQTSAGEDNIPLARSGLINYDMVSTAPDGGNYEVVSGLDTGLAGGILLPVPATLAAVAFTTQRSPNPVTAACLEPDVKGNAQAGWVRGLGGDIRTDSEGLASGAAEGTLETRNRTRFATLQGGLDGVLCDLDHIGGNLHLGFTVGNTWGESRQTNVGPGLSGTDIDFDSFFIGPYAAYTRGGFAARGSVRFDDHSLELTNPTPGIQADLDIDGSAVSGAAEVSYQFEINQFNLTPSLGLNVGKTELDDFEIAGGMVELDDLWSVMGEFGLTGSTTFAWTEGVFLSPFASGTVFHEFVEESDAVLTIGAGETRVTGDRVGTFGQLGVGVNVIKVGNVAANVPTVFGGLRADMQFGDRVQGFTANVFGRMQF